MNNGVRYKSSGMDTVEINIVLQVIIQVIVAVVLLNNKHIQAIVTGDAETT